MHVDPRNGRSGDVAPAYLQWFTFLVDDTAAGSRAAAAPARTRRRSRRTRTFLVRTFLVRTLILVVALVVLLVGQSIAGALTAPGTDSVAARLAGWARDHGGTPLVNLAERIAYKPPKVGGMPEEGIVVQAPANRLAGPGASARRAGPPTPRPVGPQLPYFGPYFPGTEPVAIAPTPPPPPPKPPGPTPLAAPPSIPPVPDVALPDEGVWQVLQEANGLPVLRATYLRADAVYTSYLASVAWMDTKLLSLELRPGTGEPGGGPWQAGASVPPGERGDIVAAFNSGFRLADSRGGFFLGGRTAGTMREGAATIGFYNDGSVKLGQWGREVLPQPELWAARQNLDLIVDGGQVNPRIDDNSGYRWGATIGNELYVWRSGIGVTENGALLYASGPRLSAATLAQLLVRAGAVRAMELDINPSWTIFVHYTATPDGSVPAKLLPQMQRPATLYDSTSSRDFMVARVRPLP